MEDGIRKRIKTGKHFWKNQKMATAELVPRASV
jgi:hypothetical protein